MPVQGLGPKQIPLPASDGPQPLEKRRADIKDQKLHKVARDFEAIFLSQLVRAMGKTIPEGSMTTGGMADLMFDQVMGQALSEGGGIGLAKIIYRDLLSKDVSDNSEKGDIATMQNLIMPAQRKGIDVKSSSK